MYAPALEPLLLLEPELKLVRNLHVQAAVAIIIPYNIKDFKVKPLQLVGEDINSIAPFNTLHHKHLPVHTPSA